MRPRHAAAIALAAWWLMVPPPLRGTEHGLDNSAPLRKWAIYAGGVYDSAAACRRDRAETIAYLIKNKTIPRGAPLTPEAAKYTNEVFRASQCIASDDPRLKKK
jgi:hypothetical protein